MAVGWVPAADPAGRTSIQPFTLFDPVFTTEGSPGLPAAEGRFPLVLFSHGFASFRTQSSFLTTHLASWGFVVISPDYIERGLGGLSASPGVPNRSETDVVALTVADGVPDPEALLAVTRTS